MSAMPDDTPPPPRAESDTDVPTKEQLHHRFYDAFHTWFMSGGCDFWSECDAPEALATIAVEIADQERASAEARAVARAVNTPEVIDFLGGVAQEAAHQRERWGAAHDRSKSAENWYWLVGYLAGKALRAHIEGDRGKAAHHTISSAAALYQWHTAIMTDESGSGIGVDADLNLEPIDGK